MLLDIVKAGFQLFLACHARLSTGGYVLRRFEQALIGVGLHLIGGAFDDDPVCTVRVYAVAIAGVDRTGFIRVPIPCLLVADDRVLHLFTVAVKIPYAVLFRKAVCRRLRLFFLRFTVLCAAGGKHRRRQKRQQQSRRADPSLFHALHSRITAPQINARSRALSSRCAECVDRFICCRTCFRNSSDTRR